MPATEQKPKTEVAFATNHALVLACLDQHPTTTVRALALALGLTERTCLKIIGELDNAGYLTRRRKGRKNVYAVQRHMPYRGRLGIGALLDAIWGGV